TVEAFSLPALGQDSHRAVFFSYGDAPIATGISPLGRDEPALRIEIQAIGPAARLAVDRGLAGGRAIAHDPIADVAEIDAKPRPTRRPLGELPLDPQLLQLRPDRNDGIFRGGGLACN